MTILTILSKEEMQLFEKPPQFNAEERNYFFTLPAWVEEELLKINTPVNKVGLILQVGYFHATKRFYPKTLFPEADVQFISKRLALSNPVRMQDYANTTLQRHRKMILAKFGYQACSSDYARLLASEASFLVARQVRLKEIFESLLLFLEKKRVEVPTYNVLAQIITRAYRIHHKEIVARIEKALTTEEMRLLDTLLTVDETYERAEKQQLKLKRYTITLLKETEQAVRPSRIQANLAHLQILNGHGKPSTAARPPQHRARQATDARQPGGAHTTNG